MARVLSILVLFAQMALAQVSPHGDIKIECLACHGTDSWKMKKDASFKHESVGFVLTGQHRQLKCETCHRELKFEKTNPNCSSCHTDVHRSELGVTCQRCHSTQSWHIPDMVQKHQQTRFPLLGRHATVTCQACHEKTTEHQYVATPTNCIGCHRTDFEATKSPDHRAAGFSIRCEECHQVTANEWGRGFDHNMTAFPFSGAHVSTACTACHQNQIFKGTPSQCVACHRSNYNGTTNPNHVAANLSTDCQTCHTTASWQGGSFDHNQTRFSLTGAHQTVACQNCHTNGNYQLVYQNCYQCHQSDFQQTTNPNHVTGNFNHDCTQCHTSTAWSPATFNHSTTNFPLTGAHVSQQCQSCHTNGNYHIVYQDCYQCHQSDFQQATNPNHVTGNFSHNCAQCHSTTSWEGGSFNHNTTNFPLTGAHVSQQCQACHISGNYQIVYQDCYQCHQSNFQQATNPNHVTGNFNHNCTQCHTTTAWQPSTFNHSTTQFPLAGAHQAVACQNCHTNGNYQLVYQDCYQCHQSDFQQTTNPNHVTGNFNHDCTQCHTSTAWSPATFNHNATNFPLTGAHVSQQCQACHISGNYQIVYQDCYQCHQSDFQQTTNPNHVTGNFSHNCAQCHSTTNWLGGSFNHNTTNFPLTGAHVAQQCQACHISGNYQLVYQDCYQCHQSDFQQTTNPNHVTGNFSHNCAQCHSTTNWQGGSFNHNTTNFPLTGAHVSQQCQACHISGNYQIVYQDCYQCHQSNFQQATNPNHVTGNFSHNCTQCHSTTVWQPSTFNHNATQFPLTGAHVSQQCQACHISGNYQLVYQDCYQCHQSDFQQATNPNHVTGNFNHNCTQCHTTTAWSPATFNHSTTNFPLTGAHVSQQCQTCHISGNYQLVYQDCYQCHQSAFQTPTNPNHVAGNFSHNCVPCHTTTAWLPSTFSHNNTTFPLTGAHQAVVCNNCHVNNNYQTLPTACFDCHSSDFKGATNPSHVAGNFNHDCT